MALSTEIPKCVTVFFNVILFCIITASESAKLRNSVKFSNAAILSLRLGLTEPDLPSASAQ